MFGSKLLRTSSERLSVKDGPSAFCAEIQSQNQQNPPVKSWEKDGFGVRVKILTRWLKKRSAFFPKQFMRHPPNSKKFKYS